MATYGRGQMLGSGINPESFKQDYSGFARAAAIQAQGMSDLGASIGGVIKDFGDEKKKINQDIAKGKSALQFAKATYPELASRIDEIGKIFSDVNVSKADQAAAGSQMGEYVTAMIRGQEFNTEVELKKKALEIQEAEALKDTEFKNLKFESELNRRKASSFPFGGRDIAVAEDGFGNIYDVKTDRRIVDKGAYAAGREDYGPNENENTPLITPELGDNVVYNDNDVARSIALANDYFGDNAVANEFPDGIATQGNPMAEGTPTTTTTPKVDGTPTPRGTPRKTETEKRGRVVTIDKLNEFTKNGLKFNAIPNEDGTYTVTDITPAALSSDTINRNVKAYEAATSLYEAGDRLGALNILRALKARDVLGDITDESLDAYMKSNSSNFSTPSTSVDDFDLLSLEKKREYLDSLTPEERKKLLDQRLNRK